MAPFSSSIKAPRHTFRRVATEKGRYAEQGFYDLHGALVGFPKPGRSVVTRARFQLVQPCRSALLHQQHLRHPAHCKHVAMAAPRALCTTKISISIHTHHASGSSCWHTPGTSPSNRPRPCTPTRTSCIDCHLNMDAMLCYAILCYAMLRYAQVADFAAVSSGPSLCHTKLEGPQQLRSLLPAKHEGITAAASPSTTRRLNPRS